MDIKKLKEKMKKDYENAYLSMHDLAAEHHGYDGQLGDYELLNDGEWIAFYAGILSGIETALSTKGISIEPIRCQLGYEHDCHTFVTKCTGPCKRWFCCAEGTDNDEPLMCDTCWGKKHDIKSEEIATNN